MKVKMYFRMHLNLRNNQLKMGFYIQSLLDMKLMVTTNKNL